MAQISFDGRFFALVLDDGRRALLLDAEDNVSNASCRSLLKEQFAGFGQETGQERSLAVDIRRHLQEAAAAGRGAALAGDAAAALLLMKHFLAAPHAARLLFIGASIASPCLRLASELLSEVVPTPVEDMPVRATLSITAAAPLADTGDVPEGVHPIRTDLTHLLLPHGHFDLLLFDARGLAVQGEALQRMVRCATAALTQGFAVLLGSPALASLLARPAESALTDDAPLLDHVQHVLLAPELSLFLGIGRRSTDVSDGGANIRKERNMVGALLQSYLAGTADLPAAIAGVRRYGVFLTEHPADVPWRAERARVAQALELLVDRRLGQAATSSGERLRNLAHMFTSL
ncbi:hypothetical protein [uncultured Selenomonas sp.]|uniref:hypothetical protein n=1 Tax=uncultured Selenomonas sp. TaxID=159275 RepID=UPI0025D5B637|nr:hypothetical protein [uncultured Selenomonas sp.]